MISKTTARLAAKWWRNRFEASFSKIVGNENVKPDGHIEALEISAIKCFAQSSLDKMDRFEEEVFNQIYRFRKCKRLNLSSMEGAKYIIGQIAYRYNFMIFPKAETWISDDNMYYKSADGMQDEIMITSPDNIA